MFSITAQYWALRSRQPSRSLQVRRSLETEPTSGSSAEAPSAGCCAGHGAPRLSCTPAPADLHHSCPSPFPGGSGARERRDPPPRPRDSISSGRDISPFPTQPTRFSPGLLRARALLPTLWLPASLQQVARGCAVGHCPPPRGSAGCGGRHHAGALPAGASVPRDGKARVDWSEHPQAEQMLLEKLHQASTAVGVFAMALGVWWKPALEGKTLALILLQSREIRSLQGGQAHGKAMSRRAGPRGTGTALWGRPGPGTGSLGLGSAGAGPGHSPARTGAQPSTFFFSPLLNWSSDSKPSGEVKRATSLAQGHQPHL